MVGMLAFFAIGEGAPNPFRQPRPVQLELAAMGIMSAGALAALKWGRLGGCIILAGAVLFQAVEWQVNHHFLRGTIILFPLAGVMHLIASILKRSNAGRSMSAAG